MKNDYKKATRNNEFESLGAILKGSLQKIGINNKRKEFQVMTDWEKIVGSQISKVTDPAYIKFKALYVNVSNHMWMHQLTFLEEEMIVKINDHMQQSIIKKIYFRFGSVDNKNCV